MAWIYGDSPGQVAQLEANRNAGNAANFWRTVEAQRQADAMAQQAQESQSRSRLSLAQMMANLREAESSRDWRRQLRDVDLMKLSQANEQFRAAQSQTDLANRFAKAQQATQLVSQGVPVSVVKSLIPDLPEGEQAGLEGLWQRSAQVEQQEDQQAESQAGTLNSMIADARKKQAARDLQMANPKLSFDPEKLRTIQEQARTFTPGWFRRTPPQPPAGWLEYAAKLAAINSGNVPPETATPAATEDMINKRLLQSRLLQELVQRTGTNEMAPFVPVPRPKIFSGLGTATNAAAPPISPRSTISGGAKIRVRSASGVTGTIPASQLAAALAAGYQRLSDAAD